MTYSLLKKICESVEEHQMRRIKFVAERLNEEKGSFKDGNW